MSGYFIVAPHSRKPELTGRSATDYQMGSQFGYSSIDYLKMEIIKWFHKFEHGIVKLNLTYVLTKYPLVELNPSYLTYEYNLIHGASGIPGLRHLQKHTQIPERRYYYVCFICQFCCMSTKKLLVMQIGSPGNRVGLCLPFFSCQRLYVTIGSYFF